LEPSSPLLPWVPIARNALHSLLLRAGSIHVSTLRSLEHSLVGVLSATLCQQNTNQERQSPSAGTGWHSLSYGCCPATSWYSPGDVLCYCQQQLLPAGILTN
jgi:hypothetical protein